MDNVSNKYKISFLLPNSGIGGGVRSTMRLGNGLIKRGHQVRIFYRNDKKVDAVTKLKSLYLNKKYKLVDWLSYFEGEKIEYNKLKPDFFDNNEIVVSMCAQTTIDLSEIPNNNVIKMMHCRGAEYENWEKMLEAWKIDIPKIVGCSRLAKMMKQETGYDVIGIVPNGVNTDEYYPSVEESFRTGVGSGYRWRPTKDPHSIIRIMNIIGKELEDTPKYLYGSGKKPKGIGNTYYKRFPTVEEGRNLYSKSKVWFLTSFEEGFGNPILEAMACGCAVISTDCGGPSDIISHGNNGFLVDIGNTGAIVYYIKKLLVDNELREEISKNAIETAKYYSWEHAINCFEEKINIIYSKYK